MNKRSSLFDNIKAVMLILVAIGHTINAYKADYGDICRIIMQYVYVIHMPAFSLFIPCDVNKFNRGWPRQHISPPTKKARIIFIHRFFLGVKPNIQSFNVVPFF
jgi:hypothetical protein